MKRYLAEAIPKQSVEGATWFFLTAYSKIWGEKNLKMELLSKKYTEFLRFTTGKKFALGWVTSWVLSISDLDDI